MSAAGRKHEHREPREVHATPAPNALGVAMWIAVIVVLAAAVGCSWGWLAAGGLLRLAEGIGG